MMNRNGGPEFTTDMGVKRSESLNWQSRLYPLPFQYLEGFRFFAICQLTNKGQPIGEVLVQGNEEITSEFARQALERKGYYAYGAIETWERGWRADVYQ